MAECQSKYQLEEEALSVLLSLRSAQSRLRALKRKNRDSSILRAEIVRLALQFSKHPAHIREAVLSYYKEI